MNDAERHNARSKASEKAWRTRKAKQHTDLCNDNPYGFCICGVDRR